MFLTAMYWISGSLFINETKGGAIFLQIDLIFSVSLTQSMYFIITLAAERTTAALEWAKWGIILDIVSSTSFRYYGGFSARKSSI